MPSPKVLVVDDQPINVQLLKRKLENEGMDISVAYNGNEALEVIARVKPDLVLLDVMMPDMDGFEVCARLQTDEATRHIPVIFVTARNSKEGKLEGLKAGAVDYITKPIDLEETLARVQTQLRLVTINREMVDLQRRLVEARRAATIGAVTQGVAHNLNNLLGVVLGYLDLIKTHSNKPDQVQKNAQNVENAVQRIVTIIRQLGTLVVKSRMPLTRCKINEILLSATARYQSEYKIPKPVIIENTLGELSFETNIEVFEDAVGKLLINAWESYGNKLPAERPIHLRTGLLEKPEGQILVLTIEDAGHGIPEAIRDNIFEPFVSSKQTVGVGMGLTVARHAVRNLGGEVHLDNRVGGGTVATLTQPVQSKMKHNR